MSRPNKVVLVKLDKPHPSLNLSTVRTGIARIVNNTIISLLGQAVTWASTLLLISAYGRFLGDIKFGELYTATNIVLLIGFPIELGFNQQITRDVAQEPNKARLYFSNTLIIKLVLWSILYSFILFLSWLLGYSTEVRVLTAICGFTLLSTAITNTFSALHYAFERVSFPVIGTMLEKGLSALIGFTMLAHGADVTTIALILLGGSLASMLWHVVWFFRLMGTSFIIDGSTIRGLTRTSIPFLTYGVLGVIYYRIDTVLLAIMTNIAVVGWYGAGYRLFDTLVFLPSLVIRIVYPIFSKLSNTSEASLKLAIEKSMNVLLFCGIPIAVGLIVTAPDIIEFIYHRAEFIHTVPALQGLAPGLIFLYINSVFNSTIISIKREKKIIIMATMALIFNLGLNLILIPLYQHVGAALVTSLTELLLVCLSIIFTPKHLLPLRSLYVGAKAIGASSIMALVIWALGLLHIFNILLILPVAMLVYFATATLIGTIPREDMRALYAAISQKTQRSTSASRVR